METGLPAFLSEEVRYEAGRVYEKGVCALVPYLKSAKFQLPGAVETTPTSG